MPKDNDWEIISKLGELDSLHFIDLNREEQPHRMPYTNEIKRVEETERKIR